MSLEPLSPTGAAERACIDLATELPATVLEGQQRPVEPASATTAAWGDPAITLRCGVTRPDALGPLSDLVVVNGVDWFGEQLTAGTRFTTVGRVAYVQVDVPDDYAPEASALVDLAPAITSTVALAD